MLEYKEFLGVAQLVARSVRDAEVGSSSLLTQTIFVSSGLGAVVARTPGGREVASSILVAPTINLRSKLPGKQDKKSCFFDIIYSWLQLLILKKQHPTQSR